MKEEEKPKIDVHNHPRIIIADDGVATVQLSKVVKEGAREVTEIKLSPLTVADLEAADKAAGEVGRIVMMLASMSDVAASTIRKVGMSDLATLSAVVEAFAEGND